MPITHHQHATCDARPECIRDRPLAFRAVPNPTVPTSTQRPETDGEAWRIFGRIAAFVCALAEASAVHIAIVILAGVAL